MTIETELKEFIAKEILRLDSSDAVNETENLTASGQVDSMSMLQILGFIQEQYSVDLLTSGSHKDYKSIETLGRAIRRLGGDSSGD